MYPTLRKEVEGLQNGIIRFTQDLVRTPSLSLCEADVAGMVENKMRDLEFDLVFTDEIGMIVAGGNRPSLATGSIHPFCGYVFVLIYFKLDPKSE